MKNINHIVLILVFSFSCYYIHAQETNNVIWNEILTAKELSQSFHRISPPLTPNKTYENNDVKKELSEVEYFNYNNNSINELMSSSSSFVTIEIPNVDDKNNVWIVDLAEVKSSFYQYDISINLGEAYTGELNKRKHYRGVIRGIEDKSLVAISFFENEMSGVVSIKDMPNVNIAKLTKSSIHIIYKDTETKEPSNFNCETVDDPDLIYDSRILLKRASNDKSSNGDCVEMEFTTEEDIYSNKGSVPNVINYVEGVFNVVATLYQNENIEVRISHIHIYIGGDPYSGGNSSDLLTEYQNEKSSINGDLSMLLTFRGIGGGKAAGFNGLCNSNVDQSLAVSGINTTYSAFPNYSWTISVITHEFGHLLGSRHTHACVWNGNSTAIDGCAGSTEGSCPVPGSPLGGGTIMSYCHWTTGINFNLGFGPQPGNVIRNSVASASCVTPCCIPNRNMTINVISGNNFDFEASNQITAVNTIFNGAIVDYDAGYEVILQPGFKAAFGSEFYAFIDGCGGAKRLTTENEPEQNNELPETDFISNAYHIYPNPSMNGKFNIEMSENSVGTNIEVLNLMGKLIYSIQSVNTKITFDISDQPNGIYLIKLTSNERMTTKKIIKQ